jgi:hypothetical protein
MVNIEKKNLIRSSAKSGLCLANNTCVRIKTTKALNFAVLFLPLIIHVELVWRRFCSCSVNIYKTLFFPAYFAFSRLCEAAAAAVATGGAVVIANNNANINNNEEDDDYDDDGNIVTPSLCWEFWLALEAHGMYKVLSYNDDNGWGRLRQVVPFSWSAAAKFSPPVVDLLHPLLVGKRWIYYSIYICVMTTMFVGKQSLSYTENIFMSHVEYSCG